MWNARPAKGLYQDIWAMSMGSFSDADKKKWFNNSVSQNLEDWDEVVEKKSAGLFKFVAKLEVCLLILVNSGWSKVNSFSGIVVHQEMRLLQFRSQLYITLVPMTRF